MSVNRGILPDEKERRMRALREAGALALECETPATVEGVVRDLLAGYVLLERGCYDCGCRPRER